MHVQALWASGTLLKMVHQLHATADRQKFTLDVSYHRRFVYESYMQINSCPNKSGDIHLSLFFLTHIVFIKEQLLGL